MFAQVDIFSLLNNKKRFTSWRSYPQKCLINKEHLKPHDMFILLIYIYIPDDFEGEKQLENIFCKIASCNTLKNQRRGQPAHVPTDPYCFMIYFWSWIAPMVIERVLYLKILIENMIKQLGPVCLGASRPQENFWNCAIIALTN